MRFVSLFACLFSFLVALSPFSHVAHAASLEDALTAAYNKNPQIKAGRSNLKATDETASQAFSGWLPSASFSKERGREEGHIGARPDGSTITDVETFRISQPLFRGGETVAQMHRAGNLSDAGYYNLKQIEQQVLLDAVTAYMDVIRDEKVLKISRNNGRVLKKHGQAIKDRFDLGEVTRTDVAQSDARFSRATSDQILAEGNLEASRATYRRVVLEEPVDLRAPERIPEIPATLDEVIAIALKDNPTYLRSQYEQKAANNDVHIQESRLLPSAAINATSRREEGGLNLGGAEFKNDAVTVNLTVPLYQSGAEYSRVRQAKHTENVRKFNMDDTLNNVRQDAVRAWQQLQVALATIESSQDNASAARIALDGVQEEADVGSRTTLDVLDAEQELFVAKTDLIRAKHNHIVAVYSLLAVMGRLDAASLGIDSDHYDARRHYKAVRFKPFGLGID